jgi:hypothetical protein
MPDVAEEEDDDSDLISLAGRLGKRRLWDDE